MSLTRRVYNWHRPDGVAQAIGAGIVIGIAEVVVLPSHERTFLAALTIAAVLLPLMALLGYAVFGAAKVLSIMRRFLPAITTVGTAAIVAVSTAPVWWLLLGKLAQGRQAARYLAPFGYRGVALIILCVLSWAFVYTAVRIWRWAARVDRKSVWWSLSVGTFSLAAGFYLLDATAYRRLYEYLHLALAIAYVSATFVAMCFVFRALRQTPAPHQTQGRVFWRHLALTLCVATGSVSAFLWGRHQIATSVAVRFTVLEWTNATSKVFAFLPVAEQQQRIGYVPLTMPNARRSEKTYELPDANVILISIDALRADHLGSYGYTRPTSPAIDALAKSAVQFDIAYCAAPLTCYSIPSLHTGDFVKSTLGLRAQAPLTLADLLRPSGYATTAMYPKDLFFCDDQRATAYGQRHFGFEQVVTEPLPAAAMTDRALSQLAQWNDKEQPKKFFLWLHYFDVHEPYLPHAAHHYGKSALDLYDGEITYVDRAIGRLVTGINQLHRPTIVVLTADHGEEFHEHGGTYHGSSLYEEQVRVPLIIAVPGIKNARATEPVQTVDVVPTVLSLLGMPIPPNVQGRSLVPELLGERDPKRPVFAEVHTKKMVREGASKLIHDFRRGTYELYDLQTDPKERRNLVGQRPEQVATMRGYLQQWFDQLRRAGQEKDNLPEAIALGRLGDRRAGALLGTLLSDTSVDLKWRIEAARLLGDMQDKDAADVLFAATALPQWEVAREAAIALGEIKDKRGTQVLLKVITDVDRDVRMRAAIALARLDRTEATPALIEALAQPNWELQNRATHYLGYVGDVRAIEPLLKLGAQLQVKPRVAMALGRIAQRHRDARIYDYLVNILVRETHLESRVKSIAGLSYLNDVRAIDPLIQQFAADPDLTWAAEALTRFNVVGTDKLPGVDFSPARRGLSRDWQACVAVDLDANDVFIGETTCQLSAGSGTATFQLATVADYQVSLRARLLAADTSHVPLQLTINGQRLTDNDVTGDALILQRGWKSYRVTIPARFWRRGGNVVAFSYGVSSKAGVRGEFDYWVLLP